MMILALVSSHGRPRQSRPHGTNRIDRLIPDTCIIKRVFDSDAEIAFHHGLGPASCIGVGI